MSFRSLSAVLFILLFLMPIGGNADQSRFQNSADEIVNALTARFRSFKDAYKSRSIMVKRREKNHTFKETITVYPNRPEPEANLKIEFDYDSCRIRPRAYSLLNELGKALTREKLRGQSFYVNGHTDSDGPRSYNLDLSLNRAQAVKDYLVGQFSIDPDRLKVRGYGEAMPIAANTTPENKQLNRRVSVKPVD